MARLDNKDEISNIMKRIQYMNQSAEKSPFTGMVTIFCYILWKNFRYGQKSLGKFCSEIQKYNNEWDEDISSLQNRIMDYVGWTVNYEPFTEEDFPKVKSNVYKLYYQKLMQYNNRINELSTRYITFGFCVLIDWGFDVDKLTRFKDKFNERLDYVNEEDKTVMEFWNKLVDEMGIYIEKPQFVKPLPMY